MIRGKVRNHVPTNIESSWNANIHNRFDIEVRDAKTNQLKQKAQAFNVICKNFWDNLTTGVSYIVYSNGSGTPSANDTTTFGTWKVVNAAVANVQTDIKNGVSYLTRQATLSETTAVGMVITEVGLAYSSSSGSLCTHAMIQDMNGNQISITKTSTDVITIYATVYVHWVPSGQNGVTLSPPIGGTKFRNFLDFALGLGEISQGTYAYTGPGMAHLGSSGPYTSRSWNASTKTLTYAFNRFAITQGNINGGIGWISCRNYDSLDKKVCAIDVRGEYEVMAESVGTGDGSTVSFATKFDMPTNAVVYVDGVAVTSGVAVKPHPINVDAASYMIPIHNELHDNKPCFISGPTYIVGGAQYWYNPLHELGIGKIAYNQSNYSSGLKTAFSNDFVNWSQDYSLNVTIPSTYRNCKYLRITSTYNSSSLDPQSLTATFASGVSSKNIVFDTPPAAGSVITIDYITPFVPKDENHVYDLSIAVQFGEYTGN